MNDLVYFDWSPGAMLEVSLPEPDDFLKIKETLTRIGIASKKSKTLYQSCHILHKQGHYYIVHFKELFALDGKPASITLEDIDRRNRIALLLRDWGLLDIISPISEKQTASLAQIKIVSYAEKPQWALLNKYTIGHRRN